MIPHEHEDLHLANILTDPSCDCCDNPTNSTGPMWERPGAYRFGNIPARFGQPVQPMAKRHVAPRQPVQPKGTCTAQGNLYSPRQPVQPKEQEKSHQGKDSTPTQPSAEQSEMLFYAQFFLRLREDQHALMYPSHVHTLLVASRW